MSAPPPLDKKTSSRRRCMFTASKRAQVNNARMWCNAVELGVVNASSG